MKITRDFRPLSDRYAFDTGPCSYANGLLSHPDVDERGIELRRSLQAIHPGLLERYLAKRTRATTARPFSGYPSDAHLDSHHAGRV